MGGGSVDASVAILLCRYALWYGVGEVERRAVPVLSAKKILACPFVSCWLKHCWWLDLESLKANEGYE